jgi:lipopolysaccharide/colanic/teichoic acid biosynthesis glycosyltransferase
MNSQDARVQYIWHTAILLFLLEALSYIIWHTQWFWRPDAGDGPAISAAWPFLAALAASHICTLLCARRILSLPGTGQMAAVLTGASVCYPASMLLVLLTRVYYSRSFSFCFFFMSVASIYAGLRIFSPPGEVRYGFIPGAVFGGLAGEWRDNFIKISSPESDEKFDILVIPSLLDEALQTEWARFIARVTISGVPVLKPDAVYEIFTGRLPLEYMAAGPGVVLTPPRRYVAVKRAMDLAALLVCLIPAAICMSVIAAAVALSSGRPVLFVQERIGLNGVPFKMYKFRSMNESGGITAIGGYLRKHRLDELPQILNVARGEMSFIGPRPEVPDLASLYSERIAFYQYRCSMLPGITGWAQVNYGYAAVTSENRIKLGYDLYYIKHASFTLDALIVLKTIRTVVMGFGSR